MEFLKIFLMVFVPMLLGIAIYWCYKKFKTSVVDRINIIGQAEIAVKTRLGNPRYINFSSLWETNATADGNKWTVKGWVEIKDKWDNNERHEYSVDVIVGDKLRGRLRYDTQYLDIK